MLTLSPDPSPLALLSIVIGAKTDGNFVPRRPAQDAPEKVLMAKTLKRAFTIA